MTSASDFFRKTNKLFEGKEEPKSKKKAKDDKYYGGDKTTKELKKNPGSDIQKPKKASNVKESGADFFRKYADIIAEAETVTEGSGESYKAGYEAGRAGKPNKNPSKPGSIDEAGWDEGYKSGKADCDKVNKKEVKEAKADEPAKFDAEAAAKRKRREELEDKLAAKKDTFGSEKSNARTVSGKAYGGAKQKVEKDDDLDESYNYYRKMIGESDQVNELFDQRSGTSVANAAKLKAQEDKAEAEAKAEKDAARAKAKAKREASKK
jgi:hypothetical protein